MIRELTTEVVNLLSSDKLRIVTVVGNSDAARRRWEELVTPALRPQRFVVVMDPDGCRYCVSQSGYPRSAIKLIVAAGAYSEFPPTIWSLVCPGGSVQFVPDYPLPEESRRHLREKLADAARALNF